MKPINLYGRMTTLDASHFLSQGYCQDTADYCMKEMEAGTYTPQRAVEHGKQHIRVCEQCAWANRVKISLADFLQAEYPDRFVEWQQGLLNDPAIAKAWVGHLAKTNAPLMVWFMTHPQNFTCYKAAYEVLYEGLGTGKTESLLRLLGKKEGK